MITRLLMGLLADVVFDSVAASRQSFADEMRRYMDGRGFRGPIATGATTRR